MAALTTPGATTRAATPYAVPDPVTQAAACDGAPDPEAQAATFDDTLDPEARAAASGGAPDPDVRAAIFDDAPDPVTRAAASGGAPDPEARERARYAEALALFALPFNDLLYRAHTVHRAHFDPNTVQLSMLLSIKTGACPEDCAYCPQSARYRTGVKAEPLMDVEAVVAAARDAQAAGATRFCMGAAWRNPKDRDLEQVAEMVGRVKELGMETCCTLGMLSDKQARRLADAGLDYYNHNIDTSDEHYKEIITTRTFQDRLDTLARVRDAGMKVCCGGIVGMGETREDRAAMLATLASLPEPPESVPINQLIAIPGTPLADAAPVDPFEFVRTIAVARVLMPRAWVRLSAGRESMSDELQALCLFAGANSMFYGDRLLTAGNATTVHDRELFERLGLHADRAHEAGGA